MPSEIAWNRARDRLHDGTARRTFHDKSWQDIMEWRQTVLAAAQLIDLFILHEKVENTTFFLVWGTK